MAEWKYCIGMKVKSIVYNALNVKNRTVGKTYIIYMNSNDCIYYIGNEGRECQSKAINEFEIIIEPKCEFDYLDAFKYNFRDGV